MLLYNMNLYACDKRLWAFIGMDHFIQKSSVPLHSIKYYNTEPRSLLTRGLFAPVAGHLWRFLTEEVVLE